MKTKTRYNITPSLIGLVSLMALSSTVSAEETSHPIPSESFGPLANGREATVYTLTNQHGMTARVTNFGATLVSLEAPDRDGKMADVTLGFDSVEGYAGDTNPYFGATCGRFGNRIAEGKFTLEGKSYQLATNNSPADMPCHLHGGEVGFNKRLWKTLPSESPNSISFEYTSPDGEEGYPGTLTSKVTYTLTEENELKWEATATTDQPTILNIVHHTYWNLSGDPKNPILDHMLTLNCDRYLPTNPGLIPTGDLAPVQDTPMDFTTPQKIGERIDADFEALKFGGGYDHCWVLKDPKPEGLALAAKLHDPKTGRTMEIHTNQPGIQFYAGNFLDGKTVGKDGVAYQYRTGLCLETENFPDAPNQKSFPTAVLKPGETYRHVMVHKFSAE